MKNMVNLLKKEKFNFLLPIIFFLVATVVILWQMLLPGYILTLDMVFTPKVKVFLDQSLIQNTLPIKYLLQIINYIIPGWLIQKIIIILIFFLSGFLGYLFLPGVKKLGMNYWVGLFLMANPFVYERFLAGHWMHLIAYAFLTPLSLFIINFSKNPNFKNTSGLALLLFLVGVFSVHFLAISLILTFIYLLIIFIKLVIQKQYLKVKKIFIYSIVATIIILILSSYWLIPYFLNQNNHLNNFNQKDWQTFATAGDLEFGTTLNVLGLYGFWAEYHPWADYFLWPKANLGWVILLGFLLFLALIGLCSSWKSKKSEELIFFLTAGIIGFIFSAGVGDTIFKTLNQFMFENIWFWPGFRDSQKWSGLLVISYAYFVSLGIYQTLKYLSDILKVEARKIIIFSFLIPILYTYTIWGGFSRQLKPVWYPESWHQVNEILNQDSSHFKALFLPWHQYLSLNFNQKLISQNPAKDFFDKPIIQGENPEVGQIYSQSVDLDVKAVENILLQTRGDKNISIIPGLKKVGIKYIIFSNDLAGIDQDFSFNSYDFSQIKAIIKSEELVLYQIL